VKPRQVTDSTQNPLQGVSVSHRFQDKVATEGYVHLQGSSLLTPASPVSFSVLVRLLPGHQQLSDSDSGTGAAWSPTALTKDPRDVEAVGAQRMLAGEGGTGLGAEPES
jgi:hypothetical protein